MIFSCATDLQTLCCSTNWLLCREVRPFITPWVGWHIQRQHYNGDWHADWYWELTTGRTIQGQTGPVAIHTKLVAGPYPPIRLVGIYLTTLDHQPLVAHAQYTSRLRSKLMKLWNLMIIYNAYTLWRLRNVPLMSEIEFLTLWAVRARQAVDDGCSLGEKVGVA